MKYFNGFSLQDEEVLFQEYFSSEVNCVAGFSYGAQKAFDYVYQSKERVDKLILLSPAFFQTQKPSFIRTQLHYFEADKETYIEQFLQNVSYPSSLDISSFLKQGTSQELSALLTYTWESKKLLDVLKRGTSIEVFLGQKDKIINTKKAAGFFTMTSIYLLKNAGHLLKEES